MLRTHSHFSPEDGKHQTVFPRLLYNCWVVKNVKFCQSGAFKQDLWTVRQRSLGWVFFLVSVLASVVVVTWGFEQQCPGVQAPALAVLVRQVWWKAAFCSLGHAGVLEPSAPTGSLWIPHGILSPKAETVFPGALGVLLKSPAKSPSFRPCSSFVSTHMICISTEKYLEWFLFLEPDTPSISKCYGNKYWWLNISFVWHFTC